MGAPTEPLVEALQELAAHLRAREEDRWAAWIQRAIHGIRQGEDQGVRHFLSACGGTGSLSDVLLCSENARGLSWEQTPIADVRFRQLKARAVRLALEFQRDPGGRQAS